MNNEGVGLVRADKVTKISETYKKGCAAFVNRLGELIRRKIVNEGKASIRFLILAKHRSTKIDYLVPVNFTINLEKKTTSLVLDESRT